VEWACDLFGLKTTDARLREAVTRGKFENMLKEASEISAKLRNPRVGKVGNYDQYLDEASIAVIEEQMGHYPLEGMWGYA
jgi:hypothetical protein